MLIKVERDLSCKELEVLIKYAKMNSDVERLVSLLEALDTLVRCSLDGVEMVINASDIFYIESVDKKTFIYCENSVYKSELRLYQLERDLAHLGFVQISKSCVLNINTLVSVKPLFNSRMEATLKNGERLCVTRRYLSNIKQALLRW